MSRADRPVLIAAHPRRVPTAARAAESVGLAGDARHLGAVEETAYDLNAMVGFLVANVPSKDEKLERPRNAAGDDAGGGASAATPPGPRIPQVVILTFAGILIATTMPLLMALAEIGLSNGVMIPANAAVMVGSACSQCSSIRRSPPRWRGASALSPLRQTQQWPGPVLRAKTGLWAKPRRRGDPRRGATPALPG